MSKSFHKGTEFANVKETWEQNERNGTGGVLPPNDNRNVNQEPLGSDYWQRERAVASDGEEDVRKADE